MEEIKQFLQSDAFSTIMNTLTSVFVVVVSTWAHKLKVKLFGTTNVIDAMNATISNLEQKFTGIINTAVKKFDDRVDEEKKLAEAITIFGDMFSAVFLDLKISNSAKEVIGEKARQLRNLGLITVTKAIDNIIPDETVEANRQEIQKVQKVQGESLQKSSTLVDDSLAIYEKISNVANK